MNGKRMPLICVFLILVGVAGCHDPQPAESDAGMLLDGGSSAPDAGSAPDGGPALDGGGSETASEAERYELELERLERGEPADLDGDGQPDTFQQANEDGSVRYWRDANGNDVPEFTSTMDASGNTQEQSDADEDGHPEYQRTFTRSPSPMQVSLWDADEDGSYERRETVIFGQPNQQVRVITEVDDDGDGAYTLLSDVLLPEVQAQTSQGAGGCSALTGFPADGGTSVVKEGRFSIYTGTAAGFCTAKQAERIQAAIKCALGQTPKCLSKTNASLANLLDKALKDYAQVRVACSNPCGYFASTYAPYDTKQPGQIAFTSTVLDAVELDGDVCAGVAHELLHLTRYKFGSDHDQGKDQIYACGRYCGGCSNFPIISDTELPPSQGENCAKCAGTKAEKAQCGSKEEFGMVTCEPSYTLCHAGALNDQACETCKGNRKLYCDGTVIEEQFVCCATCPSSANLSNDAPCSGATPGPGTNNCQKPPNCQ